MARQRRIIFAPGAEEALKMCPQGPRQARRRASCTCRLPRG